MSKKELIKKLWNMFHEAQNQDDVEESTVILMAIVAVILTDETQLQAGMMSALETVERMAKAKP